MKTIKTNKNEILTVYKCSRPIDIVDDTLSIRIGLGSPKTIRRALYRSEKGPESRHTSLWCKINGIWNEVSVTHGAYILRKKRRTAFETISH